MISETHKLAGSGRRAAHSAESVNRRSPQSSLIPRKLPREAAQILAASAHDLRNPISAVMTAAEILHEHAAGQLDASGRALISDIVTAAETALALIDERLDPCKLPARKTKRGKSAGVIATAL